MIKKTDHAPPKLERIRPYEMTALKHARTFHVLPEAREIAGQNKNLTRCLLAPIADVS